VEGCARHGGVALTLAEDEERDTKAKEIEMTTATLEVDVDVCGTDEQMSIMGTKYADVTVAITHITPRIAKSWLELNTNNRKLDKRNVSHLRDAITQGEWYMNGEAIIFSDAGRLLNGQHRLWAIMLAGVGVDVLVVRGVNANSFRTLDSGRVRRTGEVLAMSGEKNSNKVAAAVQALLSFVDLEGRLYSSCGNGRKATPSACTRILDRNPGIRDSVREINRNSLYCSQHAALLHFLFTSVDAGVAADFADVLANGHADLGRPFVVFRESLVRSPVCSENRVSYAARAIKAFNAELSGDRPKMFKFASTEEFPTINGLDYEAVAESAG
jgi:hypothetical protein